MNRVAAGTAARTASRHGGRLLRRLTVSITSLVVFGAVALTGGVGGLGAAQLGLTTPDSAATLAAGSSAVTLPADALPSVTLPTTGQDLSVAKIGSLAEQAGFVGSGLAMAIAVALAESGGNPTATDYDANGTIDRGLWQINLSHPEYSTACDYDPPCNAAAAFSISAGGTDWTAWVSYQHGAEIPFLPVAVSFATGAGALARRKEAPHG